MKALAALLVCLVLAGCAAAGYRPAPAANTEPVHGESGGGGGGGGSM
jgi:outer membrane biogenesis lipoprotein LolB